MSERAADSGSPFARIIWQDAHRLRVGDATFLLQTFGAPDVEPPAGGQPCFVLYKDRPTLDIYEQVLTTTGAPSRMLEIGIWKGGSAVFFAELFDVEKLVAIDLKRRADLSASTRDHLDRWLRTDGHADRAKLVFEVDQGDAARVREIARREFASPLDLVLDDGSHLYTPSKGAFETLFPRVRPGGWYVIEDWTWSFNRTFQLATHPWALEVPLARLIAEILGLAGARRDVISEMRVAGQLAFIRRGPAPLDDAFSIEGSVSRPPYGRAGIRARRAWWAMASLGTRLLRRRGGPDPARP